MYGDMLQEIAAEHIGDMRRHASALRRARIAVNAARQPAHAAESQVTVPVSPEVAEHAAREQELSGATR
jgi:hypothetical protein